MIEDEDRNDLGPMIRDGYSVPPPRTRFVKVLGAKLRRELKSLSKTRAEITSSLKPMASIPHAVPDRQYRLRRAIGRLPAGHNTRAITKRIFTMNRILRIAAAIIVVAAVAGTAGFLTLGNGGASIVWADVQQHIRNARTMTLKAVMEVEGTPNTEATMMFKEPDFIRMETTVETTMGPIKGVEIIKVEQGKVKMISLVEKDKKAIVSVTALPQDMMKAHREWDFLAETKKLIEESETELGEKEIDGRAVKGYRVAKGNQVFTVWADANTGQPIEMNMTALQGKVEMTMCDFEFDVELDESLFDVPEGYTIIEEEQLDLDEASPAELVEMLRRWIEARGGTFPDALTPTHLVKDYHLLKDYKDINEHDQELIAELGKGDQLIVMASVQTLFLLHPEAHYAGKGVKLGDAKTAVFWYKPKDSETYKVIYGDLSIKDVAEEDLPAKTGPAE